MYDDQRKIDIKEKVIRITLQDVEIVISSSFEKDKLDKMIEKANELAEKYNIKSNNTKNDVR
ncbi:MAG TPA: hypothetical protein PK993_03990 [Clostridia bacterium]|nr:hypothetical protein [Clostridia bacterium]